MTAAPTHRSVTTSERARHATVVHRATEDALELVRRVREEDPVETQAWVLSRPRLDAVLVALAAMVPVDRTVTDLLAWCEPPEAEERRRRARVLRAARPRVPQPCGTHAAFNRHVKNGEPACDPCTAGERVYQRERQRGRRAIVADKPPRTAAA